MLFSMLSGSCTHFHQVSLGSLALGTSPPCNDPKGGLFSRRPSCPCLLGVLTEASEPVSGAGLYHPLSPWAQAQRVSSCLAQQRPVGQISTLFSPREPQKCSEHSTTVPLPFPLPDPGGSSRVSSGSSLLAVCLSPHSVLRPHLCLFRGSLPGSPGDAKVGGGVGLHYLCTKQAVGQGGRAFPFPCSFSG